ncbi:Type I restriction modification DNA specificity domain protein [Croceitalea dokdonensis DOKDO 023]|uniref:Type I restriction modification DNA specificity domain protein n=1 Tax=Croceitalea dokdonensis DOKDO 023 TaxID=1300341 RepID=A0A0P7AZD5_9FLAO|nr:restriction endonuclease subunit S [Croceitalea dokdonensis]KPM31893.1 Type I restriction modification DNA specificity domain protein [Croceitalea dokdonensis DOKDO 023]
MNTETQHTKTEKQFVPQLRFAEFLNDAFTKNLFEDIFQFSTGKNIKQNEASPEFDIPCVRYGELYHMYNEVIHKVINKTNLERSELKFSDGDEILLPSAGEDPLDIGSASALTIENIAIGRTINILKPKNKLVYSQIYASYYINQKLKRKIASLAKGVSISNVYNSDLKGLYITLPSLPEQQKIASFLTAVDTKLQQLTGKKELLQQYKKGVMQQLFSQQLRFKQPDGSDFPDWEEKKLKDVLDEHKTKNTDGTVTEVFSVAKEKGVINQIEHLGRSYAADSTLHYKVAFPGDLIYTKSPTKDFPFGIIKQNLTGRKGLVSPLYVVTRPQAESLGFMFHCYFLSWVNVYNYLVPLVQKGAKNTMNINNDDFLNGAKFMLPVSEEEQQQIANYLSALDTKIETVTQQIETTQLFKKGLLQQLFV